MANAADLKTKTPDELKTSLEGLLKEQFNLRFQKASGQLADTSQLRKVRRNIATYRTVLTEKQNATKATK